MKPLSILCAFAVALAFGGCVDPLEKRSGSEVQEQLQRGATGQGALGPEQREAGDPANEHGIPQDHP
jgi:hypothetical protein